MSGSPTSSSSSAPTTDGDAFCSQHWPQLYRLACHRGCDPQTAQDVVQDLFLSLLRRGVLTDLSQQTIAAQSSYLSMRLRCLIINRWRDAHRQRRGGSLTFVSLDSEADNLPEPALHDTPATHHDRVWLADCISTAVSRLQTETSSSAWQQIQPVLLDESEVPQTNAQRTALSRARKKLRLLVREEMNGSFQEWRGLIGKDPSSEPRLQPVRVPRP